MFELTLSLFFLNFIIYLKIDKISVVINLYDRLDNKLSSENGSKSNFIFNNFYPAHKLNNLDPKQYDNFLDNSLVHLVKILSCLNPKKITNCLKLISKI